MLVSVSKDTRRRIMSTELVLLVLALWFVIGVLSAGVFGRYISGKRKPKDSRR